MMRLLFHFITGFLLLGMLESCSSPGSAVDGEGTVYYKIEYLEENPYQKASVLPSETILFFKGRKATFVTTVLGVIQIVNLLDFDKSQYTTLLLNSIGENVAFTDTPEDVKAQESDPVYIIEKKEERKTIAGLECSKATVTDSASHSTFDIYYYDKVKVYLGNSPYKDFNYLLMDYRDTKQGLPMHLVAQKVEFNAIDSTLFSIHGQYRWVDRKAFFDIIQNMQMPL